jgi:GNAT superfamily N-acetyltransferase
MEIKSYAGLPKDLYRHLYLYLTLRVRGKESGLRNAMKEDRVLHSFVAYEGDKIVGWCGVYNGLYCDKSEDFSTGVYVLKSHRHEGLGIRLRNLGLSWIKEQGEAGIWYERVKCCYGTIEHLATWSR